jgi:ubiquinone/menaquinone biosynthesis C-methylase UbiE
MTPEELNNIYAAEQEFWWYAGMRAITGAVLKPVLAGRGGTGLDAGCGTGYNALALENEHGLRMYGVDLAPLAIEYCHKRHFTRALAASITALPFGDGTFDLVTSFDVLSHLPPGEEERALAEFTRVLRPGGWLILRVPAFRALRSRHSEFIAEHQRFRAGGLVQRISKQPLRAVRWTYANSFLSPVALVIFRVVEPLLRAQPHSGVETMPPAWLNRLLTRVLLCEAAMIRCGFRFAFGQSLLVVAQKSASSHNT